MAASYRDLMSPKTSGDAPLEALLPRRKLVVAIGIDDYRGLPKLRCAVKDALGVQELLVRHFGFEALLAPLTDHAATKAAIETLVEDQLRKLLGPDDALILFFAGHGTTRLSQLDEVTIETGYIAPVDARGPDHFSDLINMEELLHRIGILPARHILVVLDACHSGLALGSAMSQDRSVMSSFLHSLAGNRSRRVITSARRKETALDSGPVPGHSLFTGALIQALTSGEADLDGNGIVTFSELALHLQLGVGQASGSRQTPDFGAFHLDDRGEFFAGDALRGARPPGHMGPSRDAWPARGGASTVPKQPPRGGGGGDRRGRRPGRGDRGDGLPARQLGPVARRGLAGHADGVEGAHLAARRVQGADAGHTPVRKDRRHCAG
jgi:hypothetical protein